MKNTKKYNAVVIGVSAGGMNALRTIFSVLPVDFDIPIFVVQHGHSSSDDFLAIYLNERCNLKVVQADDKMEIMSGFIYLAPPNYHLLIEDEKTLALSIDEPVNYSRPSIDVLFETASEVYGEKLAGIILTGANFDGSRGLQTIKERGGMAVVQDPLDAEVDSMPKSAIASTEVDYILPLNSIGPFIASLKSTFINIPNSQEML